MRQITSAPLHQVKIERSGADPVLVTMHAPPLGYAAHVERVYPPPTIVENGKFVPDEAAMAEWRNLTAYLMLAKVLDGEDAPTTPPPATSTRQAWDAYARALRSEFEAAGYVEGDVMRLVQGYNVVMRGDGSLGKPAASPPPTVDGR